MKVKLCVYLLGALLALPATAQETSKPVTITKGDVDAAAAAVAAGDQAQPEKPAEPGSDDVPTDPTISELAGKIDSITEGFTEARNTIEALNRMRFSGYIQAQFVRDERSVNETTGNAATRNLDQFSIRRGRVKFTYQFLPTSRFVIQPDITTSGVVLKDGYVEYTEPWTLWRNTLTAGQFNWPFGFEIMYSSSSREMPERTLMVRTLFPGERDRGVMVSGLGLGDRFNYRLAVVNGTGTSQSFDFNKRKDTVGRVGGSFGPLDVGASIYRGAELVSLSGLTAGREFAKRREGIDFQYVTPVPGLGVRGEYLRGKQPPAPGTPVATAAAADVAGWYFYAIQNLGTRHQFVVRVDQYDPNTDAANNAASWYTRTVGGSYIFHWDANSKVMIAYETPKRQQQDIDDNVWTIRYQYAF